MVCVGEAVNVSSGLGYNGVDEKGRARWNLVDNADILQIEVLAIFLASLLIAVLTDIANVILVIIIQMGKNSKLWETSMKLKSGVQFLLRKL